jgi:nitrite reductase/ring-hydroxylating ferredoxin subunit
MAEFVKVATTDQVVPGVGHLVEVRGNEIAIFNVGGVFHAIDNSCTHVGGPLCEGELNGTEVVCPWHGAAFDVTTGEALGPPAGSPVNCYNVRINGSHLEIEI